jgi:transcriptional regulator with XRE-family HTH domain
MKNEKDEYVGQSSTIQALGAKVRRLRREKGMSQSDLGDGAHISYKYVGEIERAEKNPSVGIMFRIACALGTTLLDLLDESDLLGASEGDRIVSSLGRVVRGQKIEDQRRVLRVVRVMLKD